MMHVHSLGRAARYYPERPATLGSEVKHWTFRELHDRVAAVVAGLSRHEFRAGDRLAMLLPNELDFGRRGPRIHRHRNHAQPAAGIYQLEVLEFVGEEHG